MAHIHEKVDFTASVYVVFGDTVLLHKHKKLNKWLQPGGHIELDEGPLEAALREAKEESGLDVELVGAPGREYSDSSQDLIMPHVINRHFFDATHTHEHIDFAYFARAASDDVRPEIEGGEIRWFTKADIESGAWDILPNTRAHALAALAELGA